MQRRVFISSVLLAWPLWIAFACADEPPLRVATFRCDVTPPLGCPTYLAVPLATVESRLWAKGIVLDDGLRRYVLCAIDWCGLSNSSYELFRRKLAAGAGTETSCVAIHCVHQHTGPLVDADAQRLLKATDKPPRFVNAEFLDQVTDRLAMAAEQSLSRFQPLDHIGTGQARVDRVASTRRIPIGDGRIRWRASRTNSPQLQAAPEGTIDPMLKTITLAHGDRPLVRLHYYAVHPVSYYGDPRASVDFVGDARDALEEQEEVFQIYFTGCAGDIACGKYNDGSRRARRELTERLLAGMKASVAATRLVPVTRLHWRTVPLLLQVRTDAGHDTAASRAVMADPKVRPWLRVKAARRVAFAERANEPIELSALAIDGVHILHLPGESFVEFQLFAQRLLPEAFVAVAAYGDLTTAYVCTEQTFSERGYEHQATNVAPGSEVVLKDAVRRLLDAK